jgi:hypothetical protein
MEPRVRKEISSHGSYVQVFVIADWNMNSKSKIELGIIQIKFRKLILCLSELYKLENI